MFRIGGYSLRFAKLSLISKLKLRMSPYVKYIRVIMDVSLINVSSEILLKFFIEIIPILDTC